jgi:hypothetical protein
MSRSKTTTILMADDDPSHLMLTEAALPAPDSWCTRPATVRKPWSGSPN